MLDSTLFDTTGTFSFFTFIFLFPELHCSANTLEIMTDKTVLYLLQEQCEIIKLFKLFPLFGHLFFRHVCICSVLITELLLQDPTGELHLAGPMRTAPEGTHTLEECR